ncbi:hypothetical protein ACRU44_02220 [Mycobacterium colombiense]
MWIRLLGAPWWQRWLVQLCVAVVCFGLIAPFAAPHLMAGMRWPWRLLFVGGAAVFFAALMAVSTRRASREYRAATRGLDRAERSRAIRASLRGEVPAGTAVVAAALRIGAIRLGHGRSTPNRIAVTYGLLFTGWLLLTVGGVSTNATRQTVLQGALTVLVGITGFRSWFVARRVERRVALLQKVLERTPDGVDALAAARRGVTPAAHATSGGRPWCWSPAWCWWSPGRWRRCTWLTARRPIAAPSPTWSGS